MSMKVSNLRLAQAVQVQLDEFMGQKRSRDAIDEYDPWFNVMLDFLKSASDSKKVLDDIRMDIPPARDGVEMIMSLSHAKPERVNGLFEFTTPEDLRSLATLVLVVIERYEDDVPEAEPEPGTKEWVQAHAERIFATVRDFKANLRR